MPRMHFNNLRPFLTGGSGAPQYAPDGLLTLRGLSVEELAQAAGLTRTAIYNYINGSGCPTPHSLHRICEALDIQFERALEYCNPVDPGRPPQDEVRISRSEPTRSTGQTQEELESSFNSNSEAVFAIELKRLMNEHDPPLDIRGLSVSTGLFGYENARKLVRGLTLPSESTTRELARFFGIGIDWLLGVVKKDRLVREYGAELAASAGDPDVAPFIASWSTLTGDQREILRSQLNLFLAQNARSSR